MSQGWIRSSFFSRQCQYEDFGYKVPEVSRSSCNVLLSSSAILRSLHCRHTCFLSLSSERPAAGLVFSHRGNLSSIVYGLDKEHYPLKSTSKACRCFDKYNLPSGHFLVFPSYICAEIRRNLFFTISHQSPNNQKRANIFSQIKVYNLVRKINCFIGNTSDFQDLSVHLLGAVGGGHIIHSFFCFPAGRI